MARMRTVSNFSLRITSVALRSTSLAITDKMHMKRLKILRSVEPFTNKPKNKKMKICASCGKIATQLTSFDVDWVTVLERYCDTCIKTVDQSSDADRLNEK